ncbi:unnamed protein product [Effrenium voratum]|nr:unnamed protein product [Effrenium voratum]
MSFEEPVHQLNVLSHLGFLLQMYISQPKPGDELELDHMKQHKEMLERMRDMVRVELATSDPAGLPTCHLDVSCLESPECRDTESLESDCPKSRMPTAFKLKAFVIPRMKSRLKRKGRGSLASLDGEPSASVFQDWGLRDSNF